MSDRATGAEMPFLEHLEELRWRLIYGMGALVVGVLIAFWVVMKFNVIGLLQAPIEPFLGGQKLVYTSPADPFNVSLHASVALGLVLAAPVLVWQVWAFLSPALFSHEKRVILPVLFGAVFLFLAGAVLAWFGILPIALAFLLGFQSEALAPMLTAQGYFSFVISLVLAMGAAFEMPIVILLLSFFGVVNARALGRYRRHAMVGSVIAGAVLSPGDLVLVTLAMAVPLYLLYELSIVLSRLVGRRREHRLLDGAGAA
jgi:sec-independent protein translocase protein TatC